MLFFTREADDKYKEIKTSFSITVLWLIITFSFLYDSFLMAIKKSPTATNFSFTSFLSWEAGRDYLGHQVPSHFKQGSHIDGCLIQKGPLNPIWSDLHPPDYTTYSSNTFRTSTQKYPRKTEGTMWEIPSYSSSLQEQQHCCWIKLPNMYINFHVY